MKPELDGLPNRQRDHRLGGQAPAVRDVVARLLVDTTTSSLEAGDQLGRRLVAGLLGRFLVHRRRGEHVGHRTRGLRCGRPGRDVVRRFRWGVFVRRVIGGGVVGRDVVVGRRVVGGWGVVGRPDLFRLRRPGRGSRRVLRIPARVGLRSGERRVDVGADREPGPHAGLGTGSGSVAGGIRLPGRHRRLGTGRPGDVGRGTGRAGGVRRAPGGRAGSAARSDGLGGSARHVRGRIGRTGAGNRTGRLRVRSTGRTGLGVRARWVDLRCRYRSSGGAVLLRAAGVHGRALVGVPIGWLGVGRVVRCTGPGRLGQPIVPGGPRGRHRVPRTGHCSRVVGAGRPVGRAAADRVRRVGPDRVVGRAARHRRTQHPGRGTGDGRRRRAPGVGAVTGAAGVPTECGVRLRSGARRAFRGTVRGLADRLVDIVDVGIRRNRRVL